MGSEDNLKEYFDSEEELRHKAQLIAQGLTYSERAVVFCGAGISTKSGIPDYRSSADTVLETGPGKWESDDRKAEYAKKKTAVTRKGESAWPNDSHQALAAFVEKGYVSHIVSQNVDGLLYRAGIPQKSVTEMHGNIYAMRCPNCHKYSWRDWNVPDWVLRNHLTDRQCECCSNNAKLRDTIVYFGDSLHAPDITRTKEVLSKSDFILVLGTSLKVAPSNYYVTSRAMALEKDKVAIVNLQKTNMHNKGYIEAYGFCDHMLKLIAQELHLPLADKTLERILRLRLGSEPSSKARLEFGSVHQHKQDQYTDIECTRGFVLRNTVTGEHRSLSSWPFEFDAVDLQAFDSVEFAFEFLPEQKHQLDLKALASDKGYLFNFEYDWTVKFKSSTLVD